MTFEDLYDCRIYSDPGDRCGVFGDLHPDVVINILITHKDTPGWWGVGRYPVEPDQGLNFDSFSFFKFHSCGKSEDHNFARAVCKVFPQGVQRISKEQLVMLYKGYTNFGALSKSLVRRA